MPDQNAFLVSSIVFENTIPAICSREDFYFKMYFGQKVSSVLFKVLLIKIFKHQITPCSSGLFKFLLEKELHDDADA